jgi:RNA polymerase sigma-B factor
VLTKLTPAGDSPGIATAASDQEMVTISDPELVKLVQSLPRGSEERDVACEKLVNRYESLVRSCAQRYRHSPESPEELMQVGYVGLLKAINNFDPDLGANLASYAQPCITGEIKRHFRDKRWHVHVKRSTQELRLELCRARAELTQQLSRAPKQRELAQHLGISDDDLRDAQRADLAFQASSLDAPLTAGPDPGCLADLLGEDDPQLEHTLDMESVWAHWGDLPEREQRLLMMRFYGNMTQAEIGEQLGISQMHVSRLLTSALGYLRERVLGAQQEDETAG